MENGKKKVHRLTASQEFTVASTLKGMIEGIAEQKMSIPAVAAGLTQALHFHVSVSAVRTACTAIGIDSWPGRTPRPEGSRRSYRPVQGAKAYRRLTALEERVNAIARHLGLGLPPLPLRDAGPATKSPASAAPPPSLPAQKPSESDLF